MSEYDDDLNFNSVFMRPDDDEKDFLSEFDCKESIKTSWLTEKPLRFRVRLRRLKLLDFSF